MLVLLAAPVLVLEQDETGVTEAVFTNQASPPVPDTPTTDHAAAHPGAPDDRAAWAAGL